MWTVRQTRDVSTVPGILHAHPPTEHSKSHQVCGSIKIRIILVTVSDFLHIILRIFLNFATWQQTGLSISSCFWYMMEEEDT